MLNFPNFTLGQKLSLRLLPQGTSAAARKSKVKPTPNSGDRILGSAIAKNNRTPTAFWNREESGR